VLRRLVESKRLTRKELENLVGQSERTLFSLLKALGLA
jgi:hypothetical protein